MRGTRPHRPRWHSGQGIIPACAGNTWTEGLRPGDAGDHPRVCGEHAPPLACLFDARGSSPRVRGTHGRHVQNRTLAGIIPACAGNTPAKAASPSRNRDHPRVCGEHSSVDVMVSLPWGSSPRVRGTPLLSFPGTLRPGIIPACAGNTVCCHSLFGSWWDHPRVCGEHEIMVSCLTILLGSSPRVRGTPNRTHTQNCHTWDHPRVCGEHKANPEIFDVLLQDHPRVCGEHHLPLRLRRVQLGSSPRVRGTRSREVPGERPAGIIPACAGNTGRRRFYAGRARDHPRVCGEHGLRRD